MHMTVYNSQQDSSGNLSSPQSSQLYWRKGQNCIERTKYFETYGLRQWQIQGSGNLRLVLKSFIHRISSISQAKCAAERIADAALNYVERPKTGCGIPVRSDNGYDDERSLMNRLINKDKLDVTLQTGCLHAELITGTRSIPRLSTTCTYYSSYRRKYDDLNYVIAKVETLHSILHSHLPSRAENIHGDDEVDLALFIAV